MAIYNLSNPVEKKQAQARLDFLIEKGARVEIKHKRKQRTFSQNSYLHLILTAWGDFLGYDLDEMKHVLKAYVMPSMFQYERNGMTFYKSTSGLDTKQMTEVIDKVRKTAQEEHGYYIPAPNEDLELQSLANQFERL